jgi:AraC family transcriptional regulator, regulatory protein of adaptative response / methylated-DNA-[protein]-cysteine methyltransferase
MSDYERIARVIRYLDAHHAEQPGLAELAAQLGLSEPHFHRLFRKWAGVTPKDFLQSLTLAHAKKLLKEGASVLDTALAAGFSGPGRLHDLCVTLESASPGELKSGGEGWTIVFGFVETPFGECSLGQGPRGICHLAFVDEEDRRAAQTALRGAWPKAKLTRDDQASAQLAGTIFRPAEPPAESPLEHAPGAGTGPTIAVEPLENLAGRGPARGSAGVFQRAAKGPRLQAFVRGTAFQVRVWNALLRVPPGSLVTYGRLAATIGQPSAARAVGSAVGSNPVAYLIPCHRVIRETGVIGEYHWGRVRKQAMVAWETASPEF